MDNVTRYAYSKRNSFVTIAVMLVLGLLFTSNIVKAYKSNDRIDMGVFAAFTLALLFILWVLIFKRLKPALNKEIVLEFNETCIVDYLRNVTINWYDIRSIDFKRTRSSSMLLLDLKWESDYGSQITISLRWVDGKDLDVYHTALGYFDEFSGTEVSADE